MTSCRSSLFFILFLGFNLSLPSTLAAEQLKTIDSYGNWTLDKLGYSPVIFIGQNDTESYNIEYILPQNASQGTEGWYLINLNFIIEFSDNSTNGYAYVSASTNNWSSALIKFEVKRDNSTLSVNWSERNLFGVSRYSTSSPKINISFTNYIPYKGISSGINTLTFKLEQYDGAKVRKLEILPNSGIEFTQLSPPNLTLDVKTPKNPIQTNDSFIINFVLKNVGDYPAKNVKVRPIYPTETLEPIEEKFYYVPDLKDKLEGNFEFKALKRGDYEIMIITETESGIQRPSARIFVRIEDGRSNLYLLLPAVAVTSLALVGYFFRKMERI